MRKEIKYILRISLVAIVLLFSVATTKSYAQIQDLPFFNTMKELTESEVTKPTPTVGTNNAVFTSQGVQLTPNEFNKFGAIFFKNYKFESAKGLLITFEYMVYDGDKNGDGKPGGDGFSFFMFDADVDNPGIGAPGAGLGYAYNRTHANQTTHRAPGLNGGYLGVGFDSYGNFKVLRYQGESRANGMPYGWRDLPGSIVTDKDGNTKQLQDFKGNNDVTLRGAMHPTGFSTNGWGKLYSGYPVLATQRTTEDVGFKLNPTNGTWDMIKDRPGELFNLPVRGGKQFDKSTDQGYRKAVVELFPDNDQGFYVSVAIKNEAALDTIIYRYHYLKEFIYLENAKANQYQGGSSDSGANETSTPDWSTTNVNRVSLSAPAPATFKIGFSAATGDGNQPDGQRDIHLIKNLSVSLPRAAIAVDDYKDDVCKGAQIITFEPLLNDYGYKGTIELEQEACPECIDGATFRFIKPDGTAIALGAGETQIVYDDPDVGKWTYTYNELTNEGIVKLALKSTFEGPVRVKYDVKGGKHDPTSDYAQEEYRSVPATIGVNVTSTPCKPVVRKLISNKMVTSKAVVKTP
ncbi:MAG: hypothetical protein E6767_14160 [Dysgonomonas sp.]|nr:hypothetical protein [Dysgonomonas sp.]